MLFKIRSFMSAKLHSAKTAAAYGLASITSAILITLIPSITLAAGGGNTDTGGGVPVSASLGSSGGSVSVGGLTFSFGGAGAGSGGIGDALCTIVSWFVVGGVGSAVASLAVIFLGIGAFFGKVTWGMALMFAAGIFSIFGASDIVAAITGGQGQGCGF